MQADARKFLYDIFEATKLLAEFTAGKTFDDYNHNAMLRAAVEREFQIIGEAVSNIAKLNPEIASAISEFRRIIAFRNILIHGYADVDNTLVWDIIETKLPVLKKQIETLLTQGS